MPTIPMNEYRRMPENESGWRSTKWKEFSKHCEILSGGTSDMSDEVADYGGFLLETIEHYERAMELWGIVPDRMVQWQKSMMPSPTGKPNHADANTKENKR